MFLNGWGNRPAKPAKVYAHHQNPSAQGDRWRNCKITDRCLRRRCPIKMEARFEWRGAGSQQIGDFAANSAPVAECRFHISSEFVCSTNRWKSGASEKPRDDGFMELPYPPAVTRLPSPRSALQVRSFFGVSHRPRVGENFQRKRPTGRADGARVIRDRGLSLPPPTERGRAPITERTLPPIVAVTDWKNAAAVRPSKTRPCQDVGLQAEGSQVIFADSGMVVSGFVSISRAKASR